MASVRKRVGKGKNGADAWVVSYTDQGGKRRLKTFEKKKDADRFKQVTESEIANRVHTADGETVTVKEAAESFLRDCERRRRVGDRMTGATLYGYSKAMDRYIVNQFGRRLLNELKTSDIQSFVDAMTETHDVSTVKNVYLLLRSLLKYCVRRGWIRRNTLADNPAILPRASTKRRYMPSKSEILALLKETENRAPGGQFTCHVNRYAMVRIGVFGGLRLGEMRGLHWEDIDFAGGVINVRRSLSDHDGLKAPKTEAGVRAVPLTRPIIEGLAMVARYWKAKEDAARQAIDEGRSEKRTAVIERKATLFRRQEDVDFTGLSGFVLRTEPGRPVDASSYRKLWTDLMTRAGLVKDGAPLFTIHSLRHAAASLFIEAGLPAMNLKTVIGHASVTTTYNVYGHLFPEDERIALAAKRIAEGFGVDKMRHSAITS